MLQRLDREDEIRKEDDMPIRILLFLAIAAGTSFAGLVDDAREAFLANVSKISSGSVTYRIDYHRYKENVLGIRQDNREGIPITEWPHDVVLQGLGSFQWQGEKFMCELYRVYLSTLPDNLLSTEIHEMVETWDGAVSKYYSATFSSPLNALEETVRIGDKGKLLETYGVIRPRKRLLNLVFQPVGYYSPSVLETINFFPVFTAAEYHETGLVELKGNPRRNLDRVTVDPSQSFMPIEIKLGNRWKQVTYKEIDQTWFPERMEGTWYGGDSQALYSINCELVSIELNGNYPESDFDFQFPKGTWVEDDAQGREYRMGG